MAEWEAWVDSLVGAGWTTDQIASDLVSRGWDHAEALALATSRLPVAAPPPPPWAQRATPAPAWGDPAYSSPGWADPVPTATTPLASVEPQLASFPSSEQLRRSSERTELLIRVLAVVSVLAVAIGAIAFHTTEWGDELVGSRFVLLAIPFGLLTLFAAVTDAEWFFDRIWIQMLVKVFNRNLVRAAYVVGGCWSVFAGITYGLAPTGGF